jgi:hypothetical protein
MEGLKGPISIMTHFMYVPTPVHCPTISFRN